MPNYNSKLQLNNTTLQTILSKINDLPEESNGIELPELTNEGIASDLLAGKELIDSEGNIVEGTMPNGSAKTPATTITKNPSIGINSSGLITASVSGTQSVTPTVTAGYVSSGTAGTITVAGSTTKQLTTQAAKTITPTKSSQTAVVSNVYTTGVVTVAPIPGEYITTTDATSTAADILEGETAYVKGAKITGTMSNNGAISSTMDGINTKSVIIPKGFTSGGTVSLDDTIDNEADAQFDLINQIINTANSLPEAGGGSASINLQDKTFTENGTYTADVGYDGFGIVTIEVNGGGAPVVDPRDQYQRVEYITSAEEGTYPYIITDFIADNTCGLEVIASFSVMQDRIPMGSRTDGSTATRFYCVYPLSTSSVYYGFNGGSSISCSTKVNTIYRLQTNFLNSRLVNVYEENGTRKASASISATLVDQTVPVSIFGYNSGSSGSVSSKREYKLYSARCSKGHEVVREYIPCYRKSDGVVGLYEKFSGQFLTDASGSANGFTKGSDIDW